MKKAQLFVILALLVLLIAANLLTKDPSKSFFGGLPWWGWAAVALFQAHQRAVGEVRPRRPELPTPRRHN
jgi:hypothetical protein